jgi:nucleotide-binding universal stress UspA family protein
MRKILVAIDGSAGATRALEYCGGQFSGMTDLSVTLLHVLPGLPPRFWDDGHILLADEKAERQRVVDKWLANQRLSAEPLLRDATEMLVRAGIDRERIEAKMICDSASEVTGILEEARRGSYLTLVIGRRGASWAGEHVLGSTASRIIHHGNGLAICVVE